MKHFTSVVTLALVACLSSASSAHHSTAAAYHLDKTTVIEGTVLMVAFKQPHTYLHLEVADGHGGTHRWSLEWGSIPGRKEEGITAATLRAGDHLQVTGHPNRNPEAFQLQVVHMARPSDGWTWSAAAAE